MSLESFIPSESGEGLSEAAFEALKAKMKAASAQIAAIKKEEGKQKKKEEELLAILLKFIKSSHKGDLTLLVSKALADNIPANFILSVILLGNEEIQRQTGQILSLPSAQNSTQALAFFQEDQTLPLKVKIQLDSWLKHMMIQADQNPQKLLKTATLEENEPKSSLTNLGTHVISDFLTSKNLPEPQQKLRKFIQFILKGILSKARENLDNRQLLES